jgi:hypothetical protein
MKKSLLIICVLALALMSSAQAYVHYYGPGPTYYHNYPSYYPSGSYISVTYGSYPYYSYPYYNYNYYPYYTYGYYQPYTYGYYGCYYAGGYYYC